MAVARDRTASDSERFRSRRKREIDTTKQYLADEDRTEFMGTAAKVNAGELT